MPVPVNKTYLLGEFSIEPDKRGVRRGERELHLASRPFQVLLYLVEHRDQLVTRAELLERFWQGKDVYDETLTKCVGAIRKALDDRQDSPKFIETRYAEGYRYIGPCKNQNFPVASSFEEVERTRGLKIVVEEEETQETVDVNEKTRSVRVSPAVLVSSPKRSRRAVTPALILITIIIAGGAFISYRSRARSTFDAAALAPASAPINSIAVLPLKNLTGDPANEYLSDGVSETLINSLSKIRGLRVISRTSSFAFKDTAIDPREVGRQLNVRTLLEGSVLKSGDQLRIEVRLIDVQDGHVVWARDSQDRSFRDVFAMQDEISRGVSAALMLGLSPKVEQRLVKRYTDNTDAYKEYLLGRYYLNKRTGESIKKATEHFEHATARDSRYALAFAGLADCYRLGVWFIPLDSTEAIAKTKAAASKAVELDDQVAESHRALAGAYAMEWDWPGLEKELVRTTEIDPNSTDALHDYSLYLNYMKRPDESIEKIRHAQDLDPLSLVISSDLGLAFYCARRYDEAIGAYKKVLEMDPSFTIAHLGLGDAYLRKGKFAEAIAELQEAYATGDHATIYLGRLGEAYSDAGREGDARQVLAYLNVLSKKQYVPPFEIARMYLVLGNRNAAFAWLEKAYAERSAYLVNLPIDPTFDSLRSDTRFINLLRRVGLSLS